MATAAGHAISTSIRTCRSPSDLNELIRQFNRLARAVSRSMPGILFSDPGLKTGTTSNLTLRAEAFTFAFRGKIISAAAQEKGFTATTHDVAASKEAWFVMSVQTDGTTFTITKAADQTIGTRVLPTGPDNEIIVGYLQIITGAGGIWDATTDPLTVSVNIASLYFEDNPGVGLIGNRAGVEITA